MTSKLALHHNTVQDLNRLEEFYRSARPSVALHLDLGNTELPAMIREVSPETIIVGRKYFSSQPLSDPEEQARRVVGAILDSGSAKAGLVDTFVDYNEIGPHPTHDHMRFSIEVSRRLHEAGMKYAAGSWSVGTPDVPDWLRNDQGGLSWFQLMLQVADYLALHSYCAPTMDDPRGLDADHPGEGWFTLRYAKMLRHLHDENLPFALPPIIVTECGIDSGAAHWDPGAQGGWRSFTTPQDYLEQLKWYDGHLQEELLVKGACIFCIHDQSGHWTTYDVKGEMLDLLQNYIVESQGDIITPYPDWLVDLRNILPRNGEYGRRNLSAITRIVIHHSDAPTSIGPWQIAEYHIGVKGWPGHGYHADVGVDGKTWQCQDWDKHSYHAGPANADSIGICLLGSFMNGSEPTNVQIQSTRRLIEYLEGVVGRKLDIVGHKDVMENRDCPGDTWAYWRQRLIDPTKNDWREKALIAEDKLARIERIVNE